MMTVIPGPIGNFPVPGVLVLLFVPGGRYGLIQVYKISLYGFIESYKAGRLPFHLLNIERFIAQCAASCYFYLTFAPAIPKCWKATNFFQSLLINTF